MGEYALGQPVPRSEDPRLLTGGGRYVDDVSLPGMVHGYVLRSPHANAIMKSVDTRAAKQAPGVQAVLTGEDWKADGMGSLPVGSGRKRPDGSPLFAPPTPPLVSGQVRRVGDYVAFIVADTLNAAKDAAELVEIDYGILPAVTDSRDALKEGAPAVWEECPDNICFVHEAGKKDAVEEAFKKAARIVSHDFVINRVMASSMEPRGVVGDYNRFDDFYTLYTTLQGVHPYRASVARVMKVPESHVRVIAGDVGGSFGMKSGLYAEGILALWASKKVGCPVKWTADRTEAFLSDCGGRDNVTRMELALDENNMFLAQRVTTLANLGAYITAATPNPPVNNLGTLAGVYKTPAIYVHVTGVITNTNPTCPYRGAGRPEAAFVTERIIDLAAKEIGMDPAELRRINTIPPDAMPFKTGLTFTYDCGEFEKNMDITLEMGDYAGFEARRSAAQENGKLRGIGLSNTIERAAAPGIEAAQIRVDRTGTVGIYAGSCTQGQGHETVFKQLVCDMLGLKPDQVNYVWGDTDKVPFGHGTGGSRSASLGGSAILRATEKVIEKARKIAAHMLEAAAEDIEFTEGTFSVAGTDRSLGFAEIARAAVDPKKIPAGMEPGLIEGATWTADICNYPNGCHLCEVEVDPDTGTVEIVNYNIVDDVGTVMNPLLLKGQIHGGVAQGLGQALMENVHYDADGQLVSATFMDYAMPRAEDMSFMEVKSNPVPTKTNPLGVKGAGEAGNVGGLAAVMNAVLDALSPLGVKHLDMPLTPEKLWRAIADARAGA